MSGQRFLLFMKKFKSREAAEAFVDSLTMMGVKSMLIDFLVAEPEPQVKKISMTEEQFNEHFRLIGVNENRGRPRKA